MTEIKLDPKQLLGFKIVANSESVAMLHSPKIGAKTEVTDADALTNDRSALAASTNMAALRAKVGVKTT